jgi:hypothetical protein
MSALRYRKPETSLPTPDSEFDADLAYLNDLAAVIEGRLEETGHLLVIDSTPTVEGQLVAEMSSHARKAVFGPWND